jgi:hypothetical protein
MIKILGETERGVVFRLGRFHQVVGPGLILSLPLIAQTVVVLLDRTIPGWQDVSATELDAMVEFLIMHYPEIPSHLSLAEIREAMYLDEMAYLKGPSGQSLLLSTLLRRKTQKGQASHPAPSSSRWACLSSWTSSPCIVPGTGFSFQESVRMVSESSSFFRVGLMCERRSDFVLYQ